MYFEPFREEGAVNTGVPCPKVPKHRKLGPDKRPARREIHDLSRADAQHGVHAGLDEEGKMGVGTQAAIRHEHIPGL
jgi:hypothetical protein